MTARRLARGGSWIDRDQRLGFTFDGRRMTGFAGDTLASALLANGVMEVGRSPIQGRPRGVMTAGVEEPNAFVEISEPWFEPIVAATMVDVVDGMVVFVRLKPIMVNIAATPAPPSRFRVRTRRGC